MNKEVSLVTMTLILASGCSLHPLPEDFSGDTTLQIVGKVRCEAFTAVLHQVARRLRSTGDDEAKDLADEFDDRITSGYPFFTYQDDRRVKAMFRKTGARAELDFFNRFRKWTIGYNFDFKITEINNAAAKAGFKLPLTNAIFTLDFDASNNRERQAQRTFEIVEPFDNFQSRKFQKRCGGSKQHANYIYPMTGRIGLAEAVDTYFNLHVGHGLVKKFTDKLIFTSTVSGDVNPAITLTPVTNDFHLASASLDIDNKRTDIHQVTITIVEPDKETGRAQTGEAQQNLRDREFLDAVQSSN